MKCRRCGAVLLDTDTFCVKCGQKVDEPMLCGSCGEQLREGERFCHKCGSPVEFAAAEDDEIPLSKQRTVDIPFGQIEQGILMEAEQAIVKRPGAAKPEPRSAEGYSRPGAEEAVNRRQPMRAEERYSQPSVREEERYRQSSGREYYNNFEEEDGGRYEAPVRQKHHTPPRSRYEEYDDYEEEDEDSGDSKMKIITIILGIAVAAVALVIGFIFWQRSDTSRYERPEEETVQGEEPEEEETSEALADTQGRIQILSNVNVRNQPTTEGSEVLMVAKAGEIYEYYELVDDAWYHIKLEDDREGYVSKKYVEELN